MKIFGSSLDQPLWVGLAFAGSMLSQPPNLDHVQMQVEHVQGRVYLMAGAGGNTAVQVGSDDVLIGDAQFAPQAQKLMTEIRKLNQGPVLFIVNTHFHPDHVGGNAALARMIGAGASGPFGRVDGGAPLKIIAHENVLNRLTRRVPGQPTFPDEGLPVDEYFTPFKATKPAYSTLARALRRLLRPPGRVIRRHDGSRRPHLWATVFPLESRLGSAPVPGVWRLQRPICEKAISARTVLLTATKPL